MPVAFSRIRIALLTVLILSGCQRSESTTASRSDAPPGHVAGRASPDIFLEVIETTDGPHRPAITFYGHEWKYSRWLSSADSLAVPELNSDDRDGTMYVTAANPNLRLIYMTMGQPSRFLQVQEQRATVGWVTVASVRTE